MPENLLLGKGKTMKTLQLNELQQISGGFGLTETSFVTGFALGCFVSSKICSAYYEDQIANMPVQVVEVHHYEQHPKPASIFDIFG